MRLVLAIAVASALAAGCATTDGLPARSHYSGFDRGRVVEMPPHGTVCANHPCTMIGWQWSEHSPNVVLPSAQLMGSITAITSLAFSIDGRRVEARPIRTLTSFDTSNKYMLTSERSFSMSLEDFMALASAKSVWVRVGTPSGYIEEMVVSGQADSKAIHAARRFMASISPRDGGARAEGGSIN